jgi:7,8-dihydropterin-6-yl-methyl-4-(beta-D-ribofuranosyl)aminobenzene 5'-phosphate synthase
MAAGKSITISILSENHAINGFRDRIFLGEHGLSLFVDGNRKILFDTGSSDVFIRNANLLGIDLTEADYIVLSHGHWDHTEGLKFIPEFKEGKGKLVAHPDIFAKRYKNTGEYNGIYCTRSELASIFRLILSKRSYRLSENIWFLGEIPRKNSFEGKETNFYYIEDGKRQYDFVKDDSALAIRSKKGLIVLSGCAHSGICNIVAYAKEILKERKVHVVMGGFHIMNNEYQLNKTIEYFRENPVDRLYPMHCTSLQAMSKFYEVFNVERVGAGDILKID